MEASIAALVAQWGGFGVVLLAVGYIAWHQYNELNKQREATQKIQKDHLDSMQKLQKEHAEEIALVQRSRVDDAKSVTQTLLGLQAQFNESVNAMTEQFREHTVATERVQQGVSGIDRRIEMIERKMPR